VFKVTLLLLFAVIQLSSLEIYHKKIFENLLPNAEIYIDKNNTLTIDTIQTQSFSKNNQKSLGFGYSPNFTVWIRFTLENKSAKTW